MIIFKFRNKANLSTQPDLLIFDLERQQAFCQNLDVGFAKTGSKNFCDSAYRATTDYFKTKIETPCWPLSTFFLLWNRGKNLKFGYLERILILYTTC